MLSGSPVVVSSEVLQTILNALPNPVFMVDRDHRFIMVNEAFCQASGQRREELVGSHGPAPDEQKAIFWKIDEDVFRTGQTIENEEVATDSSGRLHIIVTRKRLVHLPTLSGEQPFVLAVISDVTAIRESEAKAHYLAQHDPLTGLANRSRFDEALAAAVEQSRAPDSRVALLLLDLDGFKEVNDRHGHAAGDELLRIVAGRLLGLVRAHDTVARLGGDEFCLIQFCGRQAEAPLALAKRVLEALQQPIRIGPVVVSISASIGIALSPDDARNPEDLYGYADAALYRIKASGGHGYARHGEEGGEGEAPSGDVATDLQEAITADGLVLTFQPIASPEGEVLGYEAGATWDHPRHGFVDVERLSRIAQSSGLVREVGRWLLQKACRAASSWNNGRRVAITLSSSQLTNGEIVEDVRAALLSSGLQPERLELEIAEWVILQQDDRMAELLKQLKGLGVRLVIDGFGSAYSSIVSLESLSFDRVKIDKFFVRALVTDPGVLAAVRALLQLGRELGLDVTADGVDQEEQFATLNTLGFSALQGKALRTRMRDAGSGDLEAYGKDGGRGWD